VYDARGGLASRLLYPHPSKSKLQGVFERLGVRHAVCVGIGRILCAGRSVRTQTVACFSVLPSSNAWHKPSMAIRAVFTFLSSVKVMHPLSSIVLRSSHSC
jgi:hypothetical protein